MSDKTSKAHGLESGSYNYGIGGWSGEGLLDFGEYAECVEYCNERESGYGDDEGEWFYADEDTLTIYSGTHGNDHSPGTSGNTFATVYEDEASYRAALEEWESQEEYLESDDDSAGEWPNED